MCEQSACPRARDASLEMHACHPLVFELLRIDARHPFIVLKQELLQHNLAVVGLRACALGGPPIFWSAPLASFSPRPF